MGVYPGYVPPPPVTPALVIITDNLPPDVALLPGVRGRLAPGCVRVVPGKVEFDAGMGWRVMGYLEEIHLVSLSRSLPRSTRPPTNIQGRDTCPPAVHIPSLKTYLSHTHHPNHPPLPSIYFMSGACSKIPPISDMMTPHLPN